MDAAAFFATSATAQSFLDFPTEVRNRIYHLAIFDHDRGAVLLPRSVPRKITSKTDEDVESVHVDVDDVEGPTRHLSWPRNEGRSLAAGRWVTGPPSGPLLAEGGSAFKQAKMMFDETALVDAEAAMADIPASELCREINGAGGCDCECHHDDDGHYSDAGGTDAFCEDKVDDSEGEGDEEEVAPNPSEVEEEPKPTQSTNKTIAGTPVSGEAENEEDMWDCRGAAEQKPCPCPCHKELEESDSEEEDSEEESVPDVDTDHHCNDDYCCEPEDIPEDIMEHRDWYEEDGMRYEDKDPAILLASKQVREECLPIYYATNAFSWRFLCYDYKNSAARFVKWTESLCDQDAALIKSITFEGRHTVEEGVDFDIGIDLLDSSPYFRFTTHCSHLDRANDSATDEWYDATLARIIDCLEHEVLGRLWMLSRSGQQRVNFSPRDIAKLGQLFVKYMQW